MTKTMGKLCPQTSPTEAGRILFIGSGYQFAKKTLRAIAESQPVDADDRRFVERFLGNALLMETHWAWAGNGWGVGPFAYNIRHNPALKATLQEMMPFERADLPPRIRKFWPDSVAHAFSTLVPDYAKQARLAQMVLGKRRGESYEAIVAHLKPKTELEQQRILGTLMHARFMLVDHLIPRPDITPARAEQILTALANMPPPQDIPLDDPNAEHMGYSYTKLTFVKGPPPQGAKPVY